MRYFFENYWNMLRSLAKAFAAEDSFHLLMVSLSLVVLNSVVMSAAEGWPLLDAAFFSVATMSTVGYGDLTPETVFGKIFTMLFIVAGIGVFVTTATTIARKFIETFKVKR